MSTPTDLLIEWLQTSRRTVVFTGAGVSTLSGLPDFRGEHGLFKQIDGARVFDIGEFLRDPVFFYTHGAGLVYGLADAEPSLVHRQCARLEAAGLVEAVITQNIDMLHQRAGSRRVIELHGSPARHACLFCGEAQPFDWVRQTVARGEVPRCPDCEGLVKPDIVFFGEMLPQAALEEAWELASTAELMLALGSSLQVQPAATLPLLTARAGGRLVIINREPTPLDDLADLRLDDLAAAFEAIAERIRLVS